MAEIPIVIPRSLRRQAQRPPQKELDEFWERFTTNAPGKATTILPKNELAERLAKRSAVKDLAGGSTKATSTSYDETAALCRAKVDQIVAECRRINQKYRDPHFDLDYDLRSDIRDCLESLSGDRADYSSDSDASSASSSSASRKDSRRDRGPTPGANKAGNKNRGQWPGREFTPESVKRVGDIFDDPKFYIDGATANDVRQGRDGDCWLMAALCTLGNKPGLIERVCVAHNQDVGVYGFVFHRDGEWFSEIIDDKLYLIKPDYDQAWAARGANFERILWEDIDRPDAEEAYRRTYQSNSVALYFAQCENPNETWLPLLEKAYAKAHGDYACIEGGYTGEGIEDLTGGVTTELFTTDVLDKEHFWTEELLKVNQDFLFGCSTGLWGLGYGVRKGIYEGHAYSVMRAVEIDGQRLLLLKNPWGKGEWKGPWSDGSKEWTPDWLKKLDHRFGDDGAFWISYKDLLRKYQNFERTRLFGPEWKITSMWTTLNVSWSVEYHHTKFSFTLAKPGPVVIVLSQLDERYFSGLQGPYWFGLGFRVHKTGEQDYLVRTQTAYRMNRSCNVELELEAGEYTVLIRLDAKRSERLPAEKVVRRNAKKRREKLLRIGLAYDLAHSKARIAETAEEKAAREAHEKRDKEKHRRLVHKLNMESRKESHYYACKELRDQHKARAREKGQAKKMAKRKDARRKEARQEEAERQANAGVQKSEQAREATTDPTQAGEHNPAGGDPSTETETKLEGAGEAQEDEAKGDGPTETSADDAGPANPEDDGDQVTAEASEPEDSADVGGNTPSVSASDTPAGRDGDSAPSTPAKENASANPAVESADSEKQLVVVEKVVGGEDNATPADVVSALAKETAADTSTVGAADTDQQPAVGESDAVSGPAEHDDPDAATEPHQGILVSGPSTIDTASTADSGNGPLARTAAIERKLKKAIGWISDFKNELEGLLGESQHAESSSDSEPEDHDHPFRVPVHGAPRAPTTDTDEDTDDEDDVCSLPSLSDISDTELDYLVKKNDNHAAQATSAGREQDSADESDNSDSDPWNAVAVVGLRIYYKVAEGDADAKGLVKLRVVRPNRYELLSEDEEDGDDEGETEVGEGVKKEEGMDESEVLDVDDSAKDATVKGESGTRG
ncbi:cysteine proteinase [Trichocladium antarcticum]|uniref:Cysteine proteinase n=1 Tax=Trichocladium antarcticum TaxID=1450529 RepID=A0AAN6UC85_9PEZI|nr:cysteine proteinase [Trichocladium antarcticum]KAK4138105.1 cysteine proteinase [Trichocladium antarcticum]